MDIDKDEVTLVNIYGDTEIVSFAYLYENYRNRLITMLASLEPVEKRIFNGDIILPNNIYSSQILYLLLNLYTLEKNKDKSYTLKVREGMEVEAKRFRELLLRVMKVLLVSKVKGKRAFLEIKESMEYISTLSLVSNTSGDNANSPKVSIIDNTYSCLDTTQEPLQSSTIQLLNQFKQPRSCKSYRDYLESVYRAYFVVQIPTQIGTSYNKEQSNIPDNLDLDGDKQLRTIKRQIILSNFVTGYPMVEGIIYNIYGRVVQQVGKEVEFGGVQVQYLGILSEQLRQGVANESTANEYTKGYRKIHITNPVGHSIYNPSTHDFTIPYMENMCDMQAYTGYASLLKSILSILRTDKDITQEDTNIFLNLWKYLMAELKGIESNDIRQYQIFGLNGLDINTLDIQNIPVILEYYSLAFQRINQIKNLKKAVQIKPYAFKQVESLSTLNIGDQSLTDILQKFVESKTKEQEILNILMPVLEKITVEPGIKIYLDGISSQGIKELHFKTLALVLSGQIKNNVQDDGSILDIQVDFGEQGLVMLHGKALYIKEINIPEKVYVHYSIDKYLHYLFLSSNIIYRNFEYYGTNINNLRTILEYAGVLAYSSAKIQVPNLPKNIGSPVQSLYGDIKTDPKYRAIMSIHLFNASKIYYLGTFSEYSQNIDDAIRELGVIRSEYWYGYAIYYHKLNPSYTFDNIPIDLANKGCFVSDSPFIKEPHRGVIQIFESSGKVVSEISNRRYNVHILNPTKLDNNPQQQQQLCQSRGFLSKQQLNRLMQLNQSIQETIQNKIIMTYLPYLQVCPKQVSADATINIEGLDIRNAGISESDALYYCDLYTLVNDDKDIDYKKYKQFRGIDTLETQSLPNAGVIFAEQFKNIQRDELKLLNLIHIRDYATKLNPHPEKVEVNSQSFQQNNISDLGQHRPSFIDKLYGVFILKGLLGSDNCDYGAFKYRDWRIDNITYRDRKTLLQLASKSKKIHSMISFYDYISSSENPIYKEIFTKNHLDEIYRSQNPEDTFRSVLDYYDNQDAGLICLKDQLDKVDTGYKLSDGQSHKETLHLSVFATTPQDGYNANGLKNKSLIVILNGQILYWMQIKDFITPVPLQSMLSVRYYKQDMRSIQEIYMSKSHHIIYNGPDVFQRLTRLDSINFRSGVFDIQGYKLDYTSQFLTVFQNAIYYSLLNQDLCLIRHSKEEKTTVLELYNFTLNQKVKLLCKNLQRLNSYTLSYKQQYMQLLDAILGRDGWVISEVGQIF